MIRRILIGGLLAAMIAVAAGPASSAPTAKSTLVSQLALARVATAKYVNNLGRAKADGYGIITQMIPNMGYHYLNGKIQGFDVRKPPILVYERSGNSYQLGAIEWVFTSKPANTMLSDCSNRTASGNCRPSTQVCPVPAMTGRLPLLRMPWTVMGWDVVPWPRNTTDP